MIKTIRKNTTKELGTGSWLLLCKSWLSLCSNWMIGRIFSLPNAMRCIILVAIATWAMTTRGEVIVGRVVDATTHEPLQDVSIKVEIKQFSATYGYQGENDTDSLGVFCMWAGTGQTTLTFSLIGYKDAKHIRMYNGEKKDTINLGDIELKMTETLLKGAKVTGKRKKFYMHGDTVVYDPKAFNLNEGDRIERLIRKLPGVVVSENGQLTWNGKPIRMIVNGEENSTVESFLPQLAAEAVDKIKVYDKRLAEDSLNHSKGQRVLDVRIKREWMERWYGNTSLQYQTKKYYNTNANGYRLSDKMPFYAYFNLGDGCDNYNPGFMGGEGRLYRMKDAALRSLNLGITTEKHKFSYGDKGMKGFNFHTTPTLNHTDTRRQNSNKSENYLSDNTTTYNVSENSSYAHSLQINSLGGDVHFSRAQHSTGINATLSFTRNEQTSRNSSAQFRLSPYDLDANPLRHIYDNSPLGDSLRHRAVTSNQSRSLNDNEGIHFLTNMQHSIQLSEYQNLSINTSLSYDNTHRHTYSVNDVQRYEGATALSEIDKQYASQPSNSLTWQTSANDSWRLTKSQTWDKNSKFAASIHTIYDFTYSHDYSEDRRYRWKLSDLSPLDAMRQLQYLPHDQAEMLMAIDSVNSTRNVNDKFTHRPSLNFDIKIRKFKVSVAPNISFTHERMEYKRGIIDTLATRAITQPGLSTGVTYAINTASNLVVSTTFSKGATQFIETLHYYDDTNPLYIREGNPNLRAGKSANYAIAYNLTDSKHQLMMNSRITFAQRFNDQGYASIYNPTTGVTHSRSENVRGGHQWMGSVNVDWVPKARLKITNNTNVMIGKSYSLLTINESDLHRSLNQQLSRTINNNLKVNYMGQNLDLVGYINLANRHWTNSSGINQDYNYWDFTFGLHGGWHITNSFVLNIDGRYDGKDGYMSAEMNKDRFLLDASVEYHVMKGRGIISFTATDIFNQASNNRFFVSPTSRNESTYFSLHRFYCLKFRYNFDGRKNKKNPSGVTTHSVILNH